MSAATVNAALNWNAALNAAPGNAGPEDASMGIAQVNAPPLSAALPTIQEGSITQGVNSSASVNAALIRVGGAPKRVRYTCGSQSMAANASWTGEKVRMHQVAGADDVQNVTMPVTSMAGSNADATMQPANAVTAINATCA